MRKTRAPARTYHRGMYRSWVVLLVLVTMSAVAHAQVSRHEVDEAFAKSIGGSHACGGRYRAVFANVDTIVYRPAGRETEHGLEAQFSGHTVTLVNYVFGSTRDGTDYYHALKRGCATAPLPDADGDKPSTAKPKNLGTPSAKWDATNPVDGILGGVGPALCRPTAATALKVSHGKFSIPWLSRVWTSKDDDAKPVAVGHIDGVVHDDGTSSLAMVWDGRSLAARDVRTVRVKRALDAIQTASVTFKRVCKDN